MHGVCPPFICRRSNTHPPEAIEKQHSKMTSELLRIYESDATDFPNTASYPSTQDQGSRMIQVVMEMASANAPIPQGLGIEVETTYENLVQATVPVRNLEKIEADENVKMIRLPHKPTPGTAPPALEKFHVQTSSRDIVSEGVKVMGTGPLNSDGHTGNGVRVAVIDGGFDIVNPEISGNIIDYRSFSKTIGIEGDDTDHGTGVAEIVVDVAPDAELYLYYCETDVEFLRLVNHLIDRGDIDIVTMSLGWESFPADGTSMISEKVDDARDNGILWINAAGNEAQKHWQGTFYDVDRDDRHDFTRIDDTLDITIPVGKTLHVTLFWDDEWGASSNDYDLYLYDSDDTPLIYSDNAQPRHHPMEGLWYTPFDPFNPTTVQVVIKKYEATRDVNFQLYSSLDLDEYAVAKSSLSIPADARGSMSVGASDWRNDRLEDYSSQGPTLDGRTKPDLTGPTCVKTTSYDHNYCGTSASAPHVAGAAALIMEKYPDATADQVQVMLESTVHERHTKSNLDGTGRADVSMLVGTDILALDNSNPECMSLNSCFFPETVNVMPGDTVTWVNTDTLPITIQGSNGSGSFESETLLRGERYSMAFQQGGTFNYTDGRNTWASGQVIVGSGAPPTSSIRGMVFSDDNGNGTPDAGEGGIHTTLTLATESASTDTMGKYSFTGVTPGTHTIQVTVPAGFVLPAGESVSKTVTVSGGDAGTVNFALQPTPILPDNVTLNILAFDDDGDGIREAGEAPLPGITILTYVPATGLTDVLITGADGTASKIDLPPSSFYAIALPPEGKVASSHPLPLRDSTHYGVLDVKNPAPGSTHQMNLGIKQDPCALFPPGHFAAALLKCPET